MAWGNVLLMMWPVAVLCAEKDLAHVQEEEKAKATEETKDVLQVQVAKNQTFTNHPTPPGHLPPSPSQCLAHLHIPLVPVQQPSDPSLPLGRIPWDRRRELAPATFTNTATREGATRLEIKLCHSPLP